MHTSISFAMLLLALRENDRIFKYMMVSYSSAIIFSTLYLQIHWVLDLVAGMVFAWLIVKLTDFLIRFVSAQLPKRLTMFYSSRKPDAPEQTIAA
jgi:membrane-associated phospholipid phosphatase